ncbi:quinone oxidoreductase [Phyllobacterium sp. YR531]|uniref:quinone oxidoreductase family protein n=1 Tax=Phyllobacterium sp. YR531 TaxID=1144343 RepID=UPI00026F5B40|nr:quinone oxidoreductase [Phyllobacterium sp. YR531]EJN04452.1 Zn-dependent oxidoreductase, NADPH:quinone reductase [Phyllobacterium sp. YR531]
MSLVMEMSAHGGPDVLIPAHRQIGDPGPAQVRIRQKVLGVNFVDVYFRQGLYPVPELPAVLGLEGAGNVESVGEGVANVRVGDRVAYAGMPLGGYAETRLLPATRLIRIPAGVTDHIAGSTMLRGLTAYMLLHKVRKISPGDWVLVHAAAGGLGQITTRWAKRLGANVIGTVGSAGKIEKARIAGADKIILYKQPDWVDEVRKLTGGVHLAVDGIGGTILEQTLKTVRAFGMTASIGHPAGPIPPVALSDLGNIGLMRPSVIASVNDPEFYQEGSKALMSALQDGLINPIGAEYPLRDAAQAHRDLEAGRITGSVILTV